MMTLDSGRHGDRVGVVNSLERSGRLDQEENSGDHGGDDQFIVAVHQLLAIDVGRCVRGVAVRSSSG
jgi:hypothetical protein